MIRKVFGRRVAEKRKMLGLSLVKLGSMSGVGKSTIAYLEAGEEKSNISLDKAEAIAKALKEPLWSMLSDDAKRDDSAEYLSAYLQLNNKNKQKVIEYINDMIKLQNL